MEAMKASRCTTRREYSFWMKCTPRKTVYDERIFIINFYRMNHRMKRIEILIYRNGFDANARGALDRRQQSHSMNLFLLPWFKPFLFKLRAIISYWYWFLNRYHLVMCFCFQLKRRLLGMEMDAYGYMCERERKKESERSNERICVCVFCPPPRASFYQSMGLNEQQQKKCKCIHYKSVLTDEFSRIRVKKHTQRIT